jgi:hypothetical protein
VSPIETTTIRPVTNASGDNAEGARQPRPGPPRLLLVSWVAMTSNQPKIFGDQPMIVVAAVLRPEVRDVSRYKKKRVAGFFAGTTRSFLFRHSRNRATSASTSHSNSDFGLKNSGMACVSPIS